MSGVVETMAFRLAGDAAEDDFLAADRRVQTSFAYQQPGLLRRTTARSVDDDRAWIVVDVWRSADAADACAGRWEADPAAQAFMALVDRTSVVVSRYSTLD